MILPSGLPEKVADDEPLARFLTSSGQFNQSGVKPSAFLPNPKDGKTSVFRHEAEPQAALMAIANEHIGSNRRVHGAGNFPGEGCACSPTQCPLAGASSASRRYYKLAAKNGKS